jgi:GntR family transcriptional regulator/MocR family aminotransferase
LNLSLTTVQLAYEQLLVEGYVDSRPQSGYYVNQILADTRQEALSPLMPQRPEDLTGASDGTESKIPLYSDPACFDFGKWKKCTNKVLNEHWEHLLQ